MNSDVIANYASAMDFLESLESVQDLNNSSGIDKKTNDRAAMNKKSVVDPSVAVDTKPRFSAPALLPSALSTSERIQTNSSKNSDAKLTGWEWFASIGSPKYILGPMVGQSELPFRVLCRRYGTPLCYTPMFVSSKFLDKSYRDEVWSTCAQDRPLIVQFCANDPDVLLKAARLVENQCDAIDINLGCPQKVAKRQNYGAYLMDNLPLVGRLVKILATNLKIPVVCKIRRFEDPAKTLQYCLMLQNSGCSMLAIHPRTRDQKEEALADWSCVRALREALSIPVVVNGDMWHAEDVEACRRVTGAAAYMSAQGLLHNPALFASMSESSQETNDRELHLPPYMRRRRQFGPTATFRLSFSYSNPAGANSTSSSSSSASSFFSTPEDIRRQFKLAREYHGLSLSLYSSSSPLMTFHHMASHIACRTFEAVSRGTSLCLATAHLLPAV